MKFLIFLISFISIISAVEINCVFDKRLSLVGLIYHCILDSEPSITLPYTFITATNGNHQSSMNNENVQAFYSGSLNHIINYIPHGLDKIFPNLIAIMIFFGRIKEIHQKDLEQFPKLKQLSLWQNDIEYLEEDLFKFNPELIVVNFGKNKISKIFPTIFDHLHQLESLSLNGNKCVNKFEEKRSDVIKLIKEIKEICSPSNISENDDINKCKNLAKIKNQYIKLTSVISNLEANCKQIYENV
ncbi:hypothetical protein PVAND_016331 [Polypedilum vanderplanki]|uniref:Uncharacterized protein n=1 Tax=Polypedilum vanderplanki TaxID=319348 RepID=A0A9J6BFL4_POLVA|nr:hypothetical protein PVAND_016331 [Polypedilum vanderplanki]